MSLMSGVEDPKPGAQPPRFSSCTGPALENRILTEASSFLLHPRSSLTSSCPALLPSSLSSTSSSCPLLSTSSDLLRPSSALTGTENTLLKRKPLLVPSLCSPYPLSPLIRITAPPSDGCLSGATGLSGSQQARLVMSVEGKVGQTVCVTLSKDPLLAGVKEEPDSSAHGSDDEEQPEMDVDPPAEMPVLDLGLTEDGEKQKLDLSEEFGPVDTGSDDHAEILKETKYQFLNLVCCSLVQKKMKPLSLGWKCSDSLWDHLEKMGAWITPSDPEFLLKVAVYTRQELNIRITANFLLALAAHLPDSKPHLRRYFCAAVQLPSDWLEVTRIYSTCFSKSLPSCLKKALTDKFQQFSEYQLAKYNTRKHRCKHNKKKKRKVGEVSDEQWEEWAYLTKSDVPSLQIHLQIQQYSALDKQQSEFNMKKLIKRLHIKQPAEFVMSILGKRYPADARAFWRSGLSGVWESERANQRMRLKQPETWETRLSQEGNTAATWEKLIDNNALPFMAMLRNLRNMITQGISAKHHDKILKRLCSKSAVIQSRQFPFRFLSVYQVIMKLKKFVGSPVKPAVTSKKILRGILKKMPYSGRYRNFDWMKASRKKLRSTLSVPFVRRGHDRKRKYLQKASQRPYSAELLQRYSQALEEAVEISCRYNVPPLSGSTLIILVCDWSFDDELTGAGFCLPPDPTTDPANHRVTASSKELALLVAMIISHCCEHPQFLLADEEGVQELRLQSDSLLENVRSAMEKYTEFSESTQKMHRSNFFSKLLEEKTKVDNIIMIDDSFVDRVLSAEVERFRKESICQPLCLNILTRGYKVYYKKRQNHNTVTLYGFSELVFRFISERGSSRFLDHVEGMDKLHNIPPPAGAPAKPERTADVLPLPAVPKLRWQGVRVFISSTFRDMHAERDALLRSVFPELRRRAATLCLHLQEVDLRWGVTEEQSARATEICLSEVCRSQLLLGILGERYGVVPPRPSLPELPQYGWLSSAPDGLSVTEMEIRQFRAVFPDSAQSRMFFYFRSPQLVSSVPEEWRSDFVAESEEAAAKMSDLKTQIRSDGFKVTENYPCEWGGVVDGRAYLRGLEDFAKAVLDDLWSALQSIFTEESDEADLTSEIKEQEAHQDAQRRHFYGRAKLISLAKEKVQECQKNGGVLLVDGAAGLGKTAFMAALAHSLQTPDKMRTAPVCDVISYSTAPSQSASAVKTLLRCLVQWLKRRGEQEEAPPSDTPYRALLSEWHCQLRELKRGRPLALLVDGADLVRDPRGQAVSEWIPERLPKGVCLVLSVASDSSLRAALSKKKNCVALPVGVLPLPDRREIVQKELSTYGKKLSDSAFNNQLQTLLMKKGAASPLYLRLACEELRNYASFEKMKENLQNLPVTLSDLVQFGLTRLQDQYGGAGLDWALAALTVSATGVREQDLYALLNLCTDLSSTHAPLAWHKVLHLARNPKTRVPMATFSRLARSLRSLMGSALSREPDDPLILKHPDVRSAFERLYCPTMEERSRAHVILAAHLWVRSDPLGRGTFLHCDASALLQLPNHLMKGAQWPTVDDLLSSFYFLYANVHHGFLPRLLEYYVHFCESSELKDRRAFLKRHAPLLSHWPALFVQQALNEPRDSAAHVWAQNAVEEGNAAVVRWINNTEKPPEESGELVSTFLWTPSCVALSPAGLYVAVGTERGSLHLFHSQTNQEVKSLVSSCEGISGCVFLDEGVVLTTSYDGQVEVWDVHSGCRTAHLNAHSNRITGCDVSSDRKHFATVSLDFNLKVWASQRGTQVVSLQNPAPLNCVAFDPEGSVLAVGCWDGTVRLWDWIRQETLTTLSGHQCSVRSVTFSSSSSCASSSSLLCSGGLDGEVRLWSVAASTCVWRSRAHRGSTETLRFLCDGETLLSAGHDGMVQLWSGGLGCSVAVLGEEKKLLKTSASKHVAVPEGAALCVAVSGHHAAVGYHGDGVKVYNLQSGERVWTTEDLRVSVSCVLWLQDGGSVFLLSGGFDQRLRLWRKQEGTEENLELRGAFGIQKGAVLALDQNSTYVASGLDDFTIALWLKRDLTSDPWVEPRAANVLRGHQGGVTCLSFSPGGDQLLSGGKDQV
ncbi:telomerase protein component 1-like [Trichomycterus rosablanca]|uniref:telomerase protein component 1-like n=1 Tax=Trichomycterus rosablanca TaxID=2290929 RepID=UPI002F353643